MPLLIAGDINLDRNQSNNPYNRKDIKDTLPMLDDMIADHKLTQLNWDPTRFKFNNRPSSLDLYITNCPNKIANVSLITNLRSKHEGLLCQFSNSDFHCNPQFITSRSYKCMKKKNIMQMFPDDLYNKIFNEHELDIITEKIISIFLNIIDELAPEKRTQIKRRNPKDSIKTTELRKEAKIQKAKAIKSNNPNEYRLLKNPGNRLTRSIRANMKKLKKASGPK